MTENVPTGTAADGPAAGTQAGRRPASGGRRPTSLIVAGIALVLALGAAAFVILSGDDSSPEVEALGVEVLNATEALAEAQTLMHRAVEEQTSAAVAPDARCWYSYPEGGGEPNEFVRCGPVYFLDSAADAFWLNVPVDFTQAGDAATALVGDLEGIAPLTESVADDEELVRPDGLEAPEVDEVSIEPPLPPEAEDGAPEVTGDAATVELTEEPEDGRLHGASFAADVDAFTFTDRATLEDGQVYSPPAGHDWLVAEITMDSRESSTETAAAGEVEFLLDVDGGRQSISGLGPGYGSGTEVRTLIAAVPADAGDVSLVSVETELEQAWSFTTGARSDDAPEVYYRDPDSLSADVGHQETLPYSVTDPEGGTSREFGDRPATFTIPRVALAYLIEDGDHRTQVAGGTDHAWLYLPDAEFDIPNYAHVAATEDLVLTLADGTEIEATRFDEGVSDIVGGVVAWEVPADIREGTLTLRPGSGVDPRSMFDNTIDFRDGEVSFEFDLGEP